jgi:CubicO group peptidase (beta-lactamase class C family)
MKYAALTSAALLTGCTMVGAGRPVVSAAPAISAATLDGRIEALMKQENVTGLAIAVIDGRQITHVKAFGYRNAEQRLPLETDTIMYGASLTKAAFAYMTLQLVDEGKLDLDRPISEYLPRPLPSYDEGERSWGTLEGQGDWRLLTPRILLTHSSGLANLRLLEPDHKLRFHFKPGHGYAYSGEGYYLLQFVLEEGLGLDVKAEMQRRIFDRFKMPNTDMQWRADFASHLADGYTMNGSFVPHDERSNVSASGSMDTTIADQARMWRGMLAGEGLSKKMRAEWVRPEVPIRTAYKFPTIEASTTQDRRTAAIDLEAALGVDTWKGSHGRAFAKGGHNDWTGNIVICQQIENRCVVLLSNSVRAEIIYPKIVRLVLSDTSYPWWWTYPEIHGSN